MRETHEIQETVHPHPQFTRTHWTDLGGSWEFTYDDANQGLNECWYERSDIYTRTIQVPFPPESPASGICDTRFHPILWYRRTFQVSPAYKGKHLLLHCGAIDYRAHVWINGKLVAMHEGGHTPFSIDITPMLRVNEEQVIVIRAEDIPTDLAQPRGKQGWHEQPQTIWYHRTTGIWQPIWLEPVAASHLTQVRWTPDMEHGLLKMAVKLQRADASHLTLRVHLHLHGEVLTNEVYSMQGAEIEVHQDIVLAHEVTQSDEWLWAPEHPHLLNATLSLFSGDTLIDEVQSYIGLRSVGISAGHFLLNSHPYYLRLVLEQGYWPESHLAAPGSQALRHEVEMAKALGFNGMRMHQKIEDPRFLYWCDRLGMLVWGEMPSTFVFSQTAMQRLTHEWLERLERDYNHPCIVAWVPFNESWGVPELASNVAQQSYVQSLYSLTKAFDPTRPTIANDGWEHFAGDIYGVHDYAFLGTTLHERYGNVEALECTLYELQMNDHSLILPGYRRQKEEPVVLSECGGISYNALAGTPWFGYGTVMDSEAFLNKYRELIETLLRSTAIAGFCYTQLADTEQETNGLLTADRQTKLDLKVIHAITTGQSLAVPVSPLPN